jgi:hypothetical protein
MFIIIKNDKLKYVPDVKDVNINNIKSVQPAKDPLLTFTRIIVQYVLLKKQILCFIISQSSRVIFFIHLRCLVNITVTHIYESFENNI